MIKEDVFEKVKLIIEDEAERLRMNAAHGGCHHDYGAGALLDQLDTFICGYEDRFPESWDQYVKEAEKAVMIDDLEANEEYHEFLRLDNKFGHLRKD